MLPASLSRALTAICLSRSSRNCTCRVHADVGKVAVRRTSRRSFLRWPRWAKNFVDSVQFNFEQRIIIKTSTRTQEKMAKPFAALNKKRNTSLTIRQSLSNLRMYCTPRSANALHLSRSHLHSSGGTTENMHINKWRFTCAMHETRCTKRKKKTQRHTIRTKTCQSARETSTPTQD